MDPKAMVLAAVFSVVGSFLILVITRLWDYIWQPFFVGRNMERLTNRMGDLNLQYNNVKENVTSAGWELNSMQEEVTSVESDQQMMQVITSDELEQQASLQEEQQTSIQEVRRRLKKVESIEREVNSIQNEYSNWRVKYGVICRFCKRPFLGFKVLMKTKEVSELLDQGYLKDIATKLPPPPAQELPSTTNVWAMHSNLAQTLRYLEDGVNIIGIWGMGGVGKTTLLKQINNHFACNQHSSFDHVIFVVASRGVNLEELQKKILDNLGMQPETDGNIDSRATSLLKFLKKKKVLLLLDDLWEYINLINLGIPLEQGVCKLIFTTRLVHVCSSMKAEKLKVECLKEKEARSLFKENVGEDIIKTDPNIARLAEDIVKKCRGMPLALITIGRTMSDKKTWREWQDALNLLCSSRYNEISGMPENMFPILEFSYQNLQNDVMKECFLTCSMWPEDLEISKHDLIKCWMGLGLIDDYKTINEAYDRGHSIIESLIGACLLEYGEFEYESGDFSVKMHDVLRDLAFWIVSDYGRNKDKWIVQAGVGLKKYKAEKWVGPHRISLMHNDIESLPEQLPNCPNLFVLTLHNNSLQKIPQGLFNCLRSLMYLDLSHSLIEELPTAIGGMVNLKFLNLGYTRIKYLPEELGNLVNLKYLLLRGTWMMELIIWRSISGLPMLKLLDLFDCGIVKNIESRGGFEALKQLDGSLMGLAISIDTMLALNRLSRFSTIFVVDLRISNLEGTESLELFLPNHFGSKSTSDSLRVLQFYDCKILKTLIANSEGIQRPASLPRLERLELHHLSELEKIVWRRVTPKEFLPSLCVLEIQHCPKLKEVSWVLQLPNLKFLHLEYCDKLETVIGDAEDSGGAREVADRGGNHILAFPTLRVLVLASLPNLRSICSTVISFPSLEIIDVYWCPELKRLSLQAPNISNKLQVICGSAEWWEDLEWEDDRTKPLLQKYFRWIETNFAKARWKA